MQIGTFERLPVVKDATSAGFFPTTHREKNDALAVLAFSENLEEHPGGLHDHFMEVFDHQVRHYKKQGKGASQSRILAGVAVKSIIYTYGDFLANARKSYTDLTALGISLQAVDNPMRSLEAVAEEAAQEKKILSLNALVRYIDLQQLAQAKRNGVATPLINPGYDPMKTVERREKQENGANKRVEDVYTGLEVLPDVSERIAQWAVGMKVGVTREIVAQALSDQHKRGVFFANVLDSVKGPYKDHAQTVKSTAYIKQAA